MIKLPEELVFYIFTFMNFKSKDFIKLRNVCKLFKNLMDKPITVDCYPHLTQESFTSFTVSYNQHMNYLKQITNKQKQT